MSGRAPELPLSAKSQVFIGLFRALFSDFVSLAFPADWSLHKSLLVLGIGSTHESLFRSRLGLLGHLSFFLAAVGVVTFRVENSALINLVVVKMAHIIYELVLRRLSVGHTIFIFGLFDDYLERGICYLYQLVVGCHIL